MESEIISILDENIKIKERIKDLAPLIKKISTELINAYGRRNIKDLRCYYDRLVKSS